MLWPRTNAPARYPSRPTVYTYIQFLLAAHREKPRLPESVGVMRTGVLPKPNRHELKVTGMGSIQSKSVLCTTTPISTRCSIWVTPRDVESRVQLCYLPGSRLSATRTAGGNEMHRALWVQIDLSGADSCGVTTLRRRVGF